MLAGSNYIKTKLEAKDRKKYVPGMLVKGRNEPCCIVRVTEVIAGAKGLADVDLLAEKIFDNTLNIFFGKAARWSGIGPAFLDGS
jgi:Tat protein secretion system quality control protein TatD with DNase activity